MGNIFIKTKTVTEFVGREDVYTTNGARISITKGVANTIQVVVGAHYKDRTACAFSKDSLGDLIKILTEVRDAL